MSAPIDVSWFWDWVPPAGRDATQEKAWARRAADLLDGWAADALAAARTAWPVDAPAPFPAEALVAAETRDLLARADELPGNCRLAWGAAFVNGKLRWLPLLVVVEFRQIQAADSGYLMELIGADGSPDDIREPVVEYVTTGHGDGIRVAALARTEQNSVYGRVTAALRLERPDLDVDVLLSTRTYDMGQFGVIGSGVETLMNTIDTQFAAGPDDGVEPLRFAVTTRRGDS